jgi:aspartate carbamoyltransferase catalytic subunit
VVALAVQAGSGARAQPSSGTAAVLSLELASIPLERAKAEVVLATDVLRNQRAARALTELMRRGGRVVVLTAPQGLRDGEGYLLSLALAGAAVRTGKVTWRAAVVDGAVIVTGPHLAGIRSEDAVTLVVADRTAAQAARAAILRAWEVGAPP